LAGWIFRPFPGPASKKIRKKKTLCPMDDFPGNPKPSHRRLKPPRVPGFTGITGQIFPPGRATFWGRWGRNGFFCRKGTSPPHEVPFIGQRKKGKKIQPGGKGGCGGAWTQKSDDVTQKLKGKPPARPKTMQVGPKNSRGRRFRFKRTTSGGSKPQRRGGKKAFFRIWRVNLEKIFRGGE